MIELSKLKTAIEEVLLEETDLSKKVRADLVVSLTDRLQQDFEILDDELDDTGSEEDLEEELGFSEDD